MSKNEEIIAIKNGEGYFLRKFHVLVLITSAVMAFIMSAASMYGIFVAPAIWKNTIEIEQKSQNDKITMVREYQVKVQEDIKCLKDNQNEIYYNLVTAMARMRIPYLGLSQGSQLNK